eukprot:826311-Pyramimonas_sp.AAC.1
MAGKWQLQTAVEGLMRRTRASESVARAYPCGHTTSPGKEPSREDHRPADGSAGRTRGSYCAAGVHPRPPHYRD